ncbi:hypothetical protein P7C71_g4428, partial [Lecanoromycetidae sp. Uapishka_2]
MTSPAVTLDQAADVPISKEVTFKSGNAVNHKATGWASCKRLLDTSGGMSQTTKELLTKLQELTNSTTMTKSVKKKKAKKRAKKTKKAKKAQQLPPGTLYGPACPQHHLEQQLCLLSSHDNGYDGPTSPKQLSPGTLYGPACPKHHLEQQICLGSSHGDGRDEDDTDQGKLEQDALQQAAIVSEAALEAAMLTFLEEGDVSSSLTSPPDFALPSHTNTQTINSGDKLFKNLNESGWFQVEKEDEMIDLLLKEGIHDVQLAQHYRTAAALHFRRGHWNEALVYARKAMELIEVCCGRDNPSFLTDEKTVHFFEKMQADSVEAATSLAGKKVHVFEE